MAIDRRSHSKVDKLPPELREAINDAIVNKRMTYKDITQLINESGHAISQKSVERYGKDFLTKLDNIQRSREQAKAIIETSVGIDDKMKLAEATSSVAMTLLMNMITNATAQGKEVDKLTLEAMRTVAALERSAVSREKLKFEFDKGVTKATETIKQQLQEELAKDQGLLEKIEQIVDQVEADCKSKN